MVKFFKNLFTSKPEKEKEYLFTSESVSPGHPDLSADIIADTIKDYILSNDPLAHVAIEVALTTNYCLLMGEVTTSFENVPYVKLARNAIRNIGYINPDLGFSYQKVYIANKIHEQSKDIAMGTNDQVGGAGDQGIIFGYACDETPERIPLSWLLARELTDKVYELASNDNFDFLRPDAKSQVTLSYCGDSIVGVDTVVVSASHAPSLTQKDVYNLIKDKVIQPVFNKHGLKVSCIKHIYINPTGSFVNCGPNADSGVTGRKLVVNQYGGHSAVGGGTMQGKDATKVDLSAALMARYIAKAIVDADLAKKCQVQLAYAIGIAKPVSINIECFDTESVDLQKLTDFISNNVDCSPAAMIKKFNLRFADTHKWWYADASAHGWFGVSKFPWEDTQTLVDQLKSINRL